MYIPKNRIKTNLYTPGNEFVIQTTEENYSGYYHSLYTGEFFSGKTPNDSNIIELVKFEVNGKSSLPPNLIETNVIALFLEDPDPVVPQDQWNQKDIVTYLSLRNESTIDDQPREMPQFYYASPTEDDYQLGQFTRYFLVKVNELRYMEVSEKTYGKIIKQSDAIVWELYVPFKTQWTIEGIEDEVFDINRNQVLILEQRINRKGLQEFLNNDYLKYYKSVNINNQYTSGDDYTLPNGLNYQGLYHIMPNEIAMTGRYHGEGEDILLTPILN
tara:strand:+ start:3400 stop:4215 length:816 start_codon:yes stop_codon:yes gene_type:complete